MRFTAPVVLALVCMIAASAQGRDLLKASKWVRPYVIKDEGQPVMTASTSANGKKYSYAKETLWVPTKDQEEDDGKKTKDDLKGDENDDWSLTKYEGEALSIGKKPDTRIIFDGLKSNTDTNITVSSLATDKYGKPKHAKAKAYAYNSKKTNTPIDYNGEEAKLVVNSKAVAGARMFNKLAPAAATAIAKTRTVPNPVNPAESFADQESEFITAELSDAVKNPDQAVKTLQKIEGEVAIYNEDGELIENIKN